MADVSTPERIAAKDKVYGMEDTEFDLISKAQNGECLFHCGSDRYMMKAIAPEYKTKPLGTKGGK